MRASVPPPDPGNGSTTEATPAPTDTLDVLASGETPIALDRGRARAEARRALAALRGE